MPNTMPLVRKYSQSASFWFQCASVDSAIPPATSPAPSCVMARCSVSPIAYLVFGGLAEARHRPRHPVGGPCDELRGIDDRQPEQLYGLRGVGQPRSRLLLARNHRRLAEQLAEPFREIAHGQNLMAADIDRRGR